MRIIIFGTGQYWNNRKKYILEACDIVCFLDNNSDKWKQEFCGALIDSPKNILNYTFDYVVIMCKSQEEVYNQLIGLEVPEQKIITYNKFKQIGLKNYYVRYGKCEDTHYDVIAISTALDYNGGTIAAVYAVKALQRSGKKVLLCAPNCNDKMIEELMADNLEILIAPSLPVAINDVLMAYIRNSKMVLLNVFQMLPLACSLNGLKPLMWWIHEPNELYVPVLEEFHEYGNQDFFEKVNIVAVSEIAKNNFNERFPNSIKKTLPYSIPDLKKNENINKATNNEVTFALIGIVNERKAQDIYIDAIKQLSNDEMDKTRFYIIGYYDNGEYASRIIEEAKNLEKIIITGNLTREEMDNIYSEIDIVVCPSREDPLPIVMTEAMMYGKPCIASDSTGTADYIDNGVNGFVCKTEDSEDLCEKMRYFIHNPERINEMGQEARKVYEEYFTMDKFADRLCAAMDETINLFNNDK